MSAIAGVLRFGGAQAAPEDLQRMMAQMAASGRDGRAHWHSGPVALGHCLLRATAEPAGQTQPLQDPRAGLVLVMDGRLDNRDDLQRELRASRAPDHASSDAELVLRAYEAWGEDSPSHLLGDFAYAVWDARRQTLFCATDHVGACPLFFAKTDDLFAFASTEEALLALPGIGCEPNEELVANVLEVSLSPSASALSWLKDVSRLRAGHSLQVAADGRQRFQSYWELVPAADLQFQSEEEAQAEFERIFRDAVAARLRAAGPVAQMLSGGLDSAGILGMATRIRSAAPGTDLRSYSAIADRPETCIESQCIQSMAKNAKASFVSVPSMQGMVSLGDLVEQAWRSPHPCDNSIMLPAMMCLAAARSGERVMLHGVSGDLVWHAPHRYPAYLMRDGAWAAAWAECKAAAQHHNYLRGAAPATLFMQNAWTALMPGPVRAAAALRFGASPPPADSLFNPDFWSIQRGDERLERQRRESALSRAVQQTPQFDHAQVLHGPNGLMLGLGGYSRLGKRFGLDMRDPWADRRVVEFLLRLPMQYKTRNGWTKYLVRTSFPGELDPQVRWRVGKEHLGWQMVLPLLAASRDLLHSCFEDDLGVAARFVDATSVRARARRYFSRSGADTATADPDAMLIYSTAVLIQWLKGLTKCREIR